jgi:catechol 2,3-dioxygenase-like lactoylglutathione lyase family enzyme
MPDFPAIAHVALTVSDLSVSVPWYRRLIGAPPVLDEDTGPFHHVAFAMGSTLLALHAFPDGVATSDAFDEQRLGLDHVAFYCDDRGQLEKWQQHLDELGIEHGSIVDAHYGSGLSFRDPDHIALEFFAPAA